MRNFFILLIALAIVGCSDSKQEMNLTGTVKGLKKGTLLLQKIDDSVLVSIDSVIVDGNPNFTFSEEINSPEMYYLFLRLKDGSLRDDRIPFFAEHGEITIQTNLKNFGSDFTVTGSENENTLNDYRKLMKRFSDRDLDLIKEELDAQKEGSDSLINSIKRKKVVTRSSKYLATVNFAMNNKDKEVAPYLLLTEIYDANVKYLDTVYNSLTPKIKDSKYGTILESYISDRKAMKDSL